MFLFLLHCFVCVRTFNFYSLSKFQSYNSVLATIVTMLYTISSELIHHITDSLYPFYKPLPIFPTTPPPTPPAGNQFSTLCFYEFNFFLDSTCK